MITITRVTANVDLLDLLVERGAIAVETLQDGWKPVTDREMLYEAAINALLAQAKRDGFRVVTEDFAVELDCTNVVMPEPEPCDQLGGGCTCESCTAQIAAAVGE